MPVSGMAWRLLDVRRRCRPLIPLRQAIGADTIREEFRVAESFVLRKGFGDSWMEKRLRVIAG
jgi:hypothetical protein